MKLRVHVPTHSRSLSTATVEALLRLQRALIKRGDGMEAEFFSGAIISDLRNVMVAAFLHSDADVLIMMDADMGMPLPTLLGLIDFGQPFVGCLYPRRELDWSRVRQPTSHGGGLAYQAMSFVGMIEKSEGGDQIELLQGFARAIHVGAGLLVLQRSVFDRLAATYGDLAGSGFSERAFPDARFKANWGFFNPIATPGAPNLPEDFSFCRRWRAVGGEIWADVSSSITHVGPYNFSGGFLEYLDANR